MQKIFLMRFNISARPKLIRIPLLGVIWMLFILNQCKQKKTLLFKISNIVQVLRKPLSRCTTGDVV